MKNDNVEIVSGDQIPKGLGYFRSGDFMAKTGVDPSQLILEATCATPIGGSPVGNVTMWLFSDRSDQNFPQLPPLIRCLAENLEKQGIVDAQPDTVVIQSYQSTQGIPFHVDNVKSCVNDVVCGLSLGVERVMRLRNSTGGKVKLMLEDQSLYRFTPPVLTEWEHGIRVPWDSSPSFPGWYKEHAFLTEETFNDTPVAEGEAISFTFRHY